MTQNGSTVSGILVCPMEGDYEDPLKKVKIEGDYIEILREGYYGSQSWNGKRITIDSIQLRNLLDMPIPTITRSLWSKQF